MKSLPKLQPLDESKRREAEALDQQIQLAFQEVQQIEETLRPSGPRRERNIWAKIVQYLNADLSAERKEYLSLFNLLVAVTPAPESTEFQSEVDYGDSFFLSELGRRRDELFRLATRYQKPLKKLLLWACKPKSHPELRDEALRFLEANAHGESWNIDFSEDPMDYLGDLDEEELRPGLYFAKEVRYRSVMTPICKFILEFLDDDYRRDRLPIRFCKRLGCDRVFAPTRLGRREYCSTRCCGLEHKPAAEENHDYIWLYRLSKIRSGGALRKKLGKDSSAMKRLRQIETRWEGKPKFTEKIRGIRARLRV